MKLVCPSCGAIHSAEGWSTDADARQCLRIVTELPTEVSRRTLPYLALFRPGSGRGLTWSKALRLMKELYQLVMEAHIQWKRNPVRLNSVMAWSSAMERVIQNPPRRLPLESHGYLRSVAYDLADEEDRRKEVNHNSDERRGQVLNAGEAAERSGGDLEPMTMEEMIAIREKNYSKRSKR